MRVVLAAVLAASFGANFTYASGPGSDNDDDILESFEADNSDSDRDSADDVADAIDSRGGGDDFNDFADAAGDDVGDTADEMEVADNSGPGGGDDDSGDRGDSDDDSSAGGADDNNSGPGGGGDDASESDDDPGGGDSFGTGNGGGHSGGGHGGNDDHSGSGNSGSGSSGGGSSGSSTEHGFASNYGEHRTLTVEVDDTGEERVAGEALLAGTQADVDAALEAGFTAISQTLLPSMDCAMVRLALPAGMSVDQALAALKEIAPNALVTANTIYQHAEGSISARPTTRRARAPAYRGLMGVIDTGVSAAALAPNGLVSQRAFAGGAPVRREHGEAVAALAIEHGMRVQVADVFSGTTAGGEVASAESIVAALDWMIETDVPVINISIEGPNNVLLQALVGRASERGHVIVAAAGNGGPLATPAFPAAFERSVAITAIDGNDRPYVRANRGGYIDFAANGVNVRVQSGNQDLLVSGTSFAAPVVAARIAEQMGRPSPRRAAEILAELRQHAVDLGAPGRDPIFGWGAVRD